MSDQSQITPVAGFVLVLTSLAKHNAATLGGRSGRQYRFRYSEAHQGFARQYRDPADWIREQKDIFHPLQRNNQGIRHYSTILTEAEAADLDDAVARDKAVYDERTRVAQAQIEHSAALRKQGLHPAQIAAKQAARPAPPLPTEEQAGPSAIVDLADDQEDEFKAAAAAAVAAAAEENLALGTVYKRPPEDADDLTVLKGVGDAMLSKLNASGVYKLEQIAEWSEDQQSAWEQVLRMKEGLIAKNKWQETAKEAIDDSNKVADELSDDQEDDPEEQ